MVKNPTMQKFHSSPKNQSPHPKWKSLRQKPISSANKTHRAAALSGFEIRHPIRRQASTSNAISKWHNNNFTSISSKHESIIDLTPSALCLPVVLGWSNGKYRPRRNDPKTLYYSHGCTLSRHFIESQIGSVIISVIWSMRPETSSQYFSPAKCLSCF